ncbi:MAG: cupin domain-containing protein [Chitinophagaceae bacterium]|nr:cupin domain-containing protein [Chitinophagaceae bacterium]
MTSRDLIASGVIELYCLGIASEEENLLVEQLALNDQLLKDEIAAVNDALAKFAVAVSNIAPPQYLKEKIISTIESINIEKPTGNLPPRLTAESTITEWLDYLKVNQVAPSETKEELVVIDLPGTEDFVTYVVFGKPGAGVAEEVHSGHDEYLFICKGECEMTIAGIKSAHKPGDFLTITPGTLHSAVVTGNGPMIVIGQRRAA